MLSNNAIETIRTDFQTTIQAALTYTVGITNFTEAKVVQEFVDVASIYPCVVIDLTTSESPNRYVGARNNNVLQFDIFVLTVKPTHPNHVVACSDTANRSGRQLAEYLALKVYNYLNNTYVPNFSYIQKDVNLVLNPDFSEREGVFKTIVQFAVLV